MGLPEVIDFGHSWPMTFLYSLFSHQKLLLLRNKGSANGVVGSVVFLTETSRGSEPRETELDNTSQKWRNFPFIRRKENVV